MDSGHLVRGTTSTIREVAPANSFEFGPAGPPLQAWIPPQESALREYLRVLIKRKWTVIGESRDNFNHLAFPRRDRFRVFFKRLRALPLKVPLGIILVGRAEPIG